MLKKSQCRSKKILPINKMSKEAQALQEELIALSKTTKVRPKIISNNDVYQFVDLKKAKNRFQNINK